MAEQGKVAMISGGNRGIGRATVVEMAAQGWRVSVGCRKPEAFDRSGLPDAVVPFRFDALDPASETAWVADTKARFGRIDALVHCAGIAIRKTVLTIEDAEFDEMFDVNVKSPLRLSQKAWPHLVACGEGRIVVLASLSGKRVRSENTGVYAMSKHAAVALAHALRRSGHPLGIRVTAICPGLVDTDMTAGYRDRVPAAEMTQPGDVARLIRTVIELPSTASVAEIPINYGMEDSY